VRFFPNKPRRFMRETGALMGIASSSRKTPFFVYLPFPFFFVFHPFDRSLYSEFRFFSVFVLPLQEAPGMISPHLIDRPSA